MAGNSGTAGTTETALARKRAGTRGRSRTTASGGKIGFASIREYESFKGGFRAEVKQETDLDGRASEIVEKLLTMDRGQRLHALTSTITLSATRKSLRK